MRRTAGSIEACMRCGSRELRWPAASDGAMVGQAANLAERVCQRGHVGVALLFDDEASWRAFVGSLKP
ncbi:MAG TPA: hypothetical protein VM286_06435 [Candidatus Thermoplasmatota archaeon]|nr:hypothetical protein [Candidatus Thermoplasmatota archaeon]